MRETTCSMISTGSSCGGGGGGICRSNGGKSGGGGGMGCGMTRPAHCRATRAGTGLPTRSLSIWSLPSSGRRGSSHEMIRPPVLFGKELEPGAVKEYGE